MYNHQIGFQKIILSRITINAEGCWIISGSKSHGYGQISVKHIPRRAHRISYEVFVGPIPEGLELDHTCHDPQICAGGSACPHRACVNPAHLMPVTKAFNLSPARNARNKPRTHCAQGHKYTLENTLKQGYKGEEKKWRACRECKRIDCARRQAKKKAAQLAPPSCFGRAAIIS